MLVSHEMSWKLRLGTNQFNRCQAAEFWARIIISGCWFHTATDTWWLAPGPAAGRAELGAGLCFQGHGVAGELLQGREDGGNVGLRVLITI